MFFKLAFNHPRQKRCVFLLFFVSARPVNSVKLCLIFMRTTSSFWSAIQKIHCNLVKEPLKNPNLNPKLQPSLYLHPLSHSPSNPHPPPPPDGTFTMGIFKFIASINYFAKPLKDKTAASKIEKIGTWMYIAFGLLSSFYLYDLSKDAWQDGLKYTTTVTEISPMLAFKDLEDSQTISMVIAPPSSSSWSAP